MNERDIKFLPQRLSLIRPWPGGLRRLKPNNSSHPLRERVSSSSIIVFSFLLLVVFPSVLSLIYYTVFASDVYVSEGKLIVRESFDPEGAVAPSGGISSLLGKMGLAGGGASTQNPMIISDYIKSRSSISDIGIEKVRALYDNPKADLWSRLDHAADMEEVWAYWKDQVFVYADPTSGIVTLRVRAFTPQDSLDLANILLSNSERLINNISQRARQDALVRSEQEVARAMAALASARTDMLDFQKRSNLLDPQDTAKEIMTLISELTLKKIELESQINAADRAGANFRPGDRYQRSSIDVIGNQIDDLNALLTGSGSGSLTAKLKDFELLKLKEQFAEQLYTIARSGYEDARRKSIKQLLYVAVIVSPTLPDAPLYPKIFEGTSVAFIASLVLWGIGSLLVATIRDSAQI